ncbi:MAG: ABC transporter ATP-binding protein [Rhodospirillales bacterium]|nr:ABC transporter ATP-binding protein [Rhodospirillales bacterium]
MAALDIADVRKDYGAGPVLAGTSLRVESGRLVAVLGASGSGKTTLLRLIAGFEHIDAGSIAIGGTTVASPGLHLPPEQRHIGYMAQEGALFPHLSVGRNISFGLGRGRHERRVSELLELVGLPADYSARLPQMLSGGEQQRVALARALAPSPRLVLLDEPFSSLDAALRQEVRQAVAATLKALGNTAILVTHDQGEALSMGDEVAVLRGGRIVQHTDPISLYHRPGDIDLARFIGETVILAGQAHGAFAVTPLGTLALATPGQGAVRILVRPEQIRLVTAGTPGSVPAEIAGTRYFGHDALVELRLSAAAGARVTARVFSHAVPLTKGPVGVMVDGSVIAFPDSDAIPMNA